MISRKQALVTPIGWIEPGALYQYGLSTLCQNRGSVYRGPNRVDLKVCRRGQPSRVRRRKRNGPVSVCCVCCVSCSSCVCCAESARNFLKIKTEMLRTAFAQIYAATTTSACRALIAWHVGIWCNARAFSRASITHCPAHNPKEIADAGASARALLCHVFAMPTVPAAGLLTRRNF